MGHEGQTLLWVYRSSVLAFVFPEAIHLGADYSLAKEVLCL